jgi:hypothetical protein
MDLIDQVLDNLGVLVEGQSPTTELRNKIDRLVDANVEMLRVEEICYIADIGTAGPPAGGSIELKLFLPLADTLAWACSPSFNLAGDPSLKALDVLARDRLLVLTRPERSRRMLSVDPATRTPRRTGSGNFSSGT